MKDVNKIILIGRLGNDPIHRHTKAGKSVVHLSLATSRQIARENPDSPGQFTSVEETQWHKVVVWGKQGEACAQYLKKGNAIYVEGYLKTREYRDKNDQPREATEVLAEEVSFLSQKRSPAQSNIPNEDTHSVSSMIQ